MDESYSSSEYDAKVVEDIVFSKYGVKFDKAISKFRQRRDSASTEENWRENKTRSIDTCNLSLLISEQTSLPPYTSCNSVEIVCEDPELFNLSPNSKTKKLRGLYKTRHQVLKAIHFCNSLPAKPDLLQERIEAEKILLLTDIQRNLLENYVNKVEPVTPFSSATIELSELYYWSTTILNSDEYFLCVIISGFQVLSSEISKANSNGSVSFKKMFVVEPLQENFEMHLKLYKISPKIFEKKSSGLKMNCCRAEEPVMYFYRPSLFKCHTILSLTLKHFKTNTLNLKLRSGFLTASVDSRVNINVNTIGFLDVSVTDKNFPVWNKQWCHLDGKFMKLYNYPPSEHDSIEPSLLINFYNCLDVQVLNREECSRKQTLLLKSRSGSINVFLHCECPYHFEVWTKNMNFVLEQIRLWENV